MDVEAIQEAITTLESRGELVTAPKVREVLGQGSYRDIYQGLRALGYLTPTASEEEDDAPSDRAEETYAADALDQAEAAVARAEAQVAALDAQRPSLEAAIEQARETVLQAVMRQLAAKECRWRGYWPTEDEVVLQALDAEVRATALAYREARQDAAQVEATLATARQAVWAAQRAMEDARRERYVRQQHPDLWHEWQQALAERDDDPALSEQGWREPGTRMCIKTKHEERIGLIERQIAQVVQEAGV